MLLSTDRRILENIRDSKNGYTFKQLSDLSGISAGDITKSLQYLTGKDLIASFERPEGRTFIITEAGAQELGGKVEPTKMKCRYCEKPYSQPGWLRKHEADCEKRPEANGPSEKKSSLVRAATLAKPDAVERTKEAITKMFPEPQGWTIRCSGCGALYAIRKRECGAELLECPLCVKET